MTGASARRTPRGPSISTQSRRKIGRKWQDLPGRTYRACSSRDSAWLLRLATAIQWRQAFSRQLHLLSWLVTLARLGPCRILFVMERCRCPQRQTSRGMTDKSRLKQPRYSLTIWKTGWKNPERLKALFIYATSTGRCCADSPPFASAGENEIRLLVTIKIFKQRSAAQGKTLAKLSFTFSIPFVFCKCHGSQSQEKQYSCLGALSAIFWVDSSERVLAVNSCAFNGKTSYSNIGTKCSVISTNKNITSPIPTVPPNA